MQANNIIDIAKQLVAFIDKQENDCLFEFITPYLGGKKVTVKRMIKKGIVRMYNETTFEVWYELNGKVITPSFIRNPKTLVDLFMKND